MLVAIAVRAILGLQQAANLVAAASDPAFLCTAAVCATKTLAIRGGGATRHGAGLPLLPSTVCDALIEPLSCTVFIRVYNNCNVAAKRSLYHVYCWQFVAPPLLLLSELHATAWTVALPLDINVTA